MKRSGRILLLAALGLLAAGESRAQLIKPETVVEAKVEPSSATLRRSRAADLTVVATIREGFHVNSNKPTLDYLVPTQIELVEAPGFVLEKADYPAGELKAFGFAPDEKLSVYEGTIRVPVRLRAKADAAAGAHELRLAFHYQACNDRLCLRPARREVTVKVVVQ